MKYEDIELTEDELNLVVELEYAGFSEEVAKGWVRDIIFNRVNDALAGALHPEFGTEWRRPDGVIWKAVRQATEVEKADHTCDSGWFDRTICPEPCGAMHSYCDTCGERQDACAHEATRIAGER